MHGHAHAHKYTHTYTNTCALLQPKRMWLCSPLCASPPAWQMHLLSKSWWIFSLNSKSKPHFLSPSLLREPSMSAMPPASPGNHSLTKLRWKKTNIALDSYLHPMLILCDEWEQHIHLYMNTSYQMSSEYAVPLSCCHLPDFPFDKLCCDHILCIFLFLFFALFSVFKVTLISPTPRSPQSTSAALFHFFVLSTASLPEWQLTEVGSILIYFTWLWIFSVNRAVFMHGCQISCVLIRGIFNLICWLTE